MPIGSTMMYVKTLLDGLHVPGLRDLEAFVKPPDPITAMTRPTAFVWDPSGGVRRSSSPRSKPPANRLGHYQPAPPAGWKWTDHSLSIWCTWFNDNADPRADTAFPAVVDIVMMTLETCQMPSPIIVDPVTGFQTQLIDLGKNMKWTFQNVHSAAEQRIERFDAEIIAPVEEWYSA